MSMSFKWDDSELKKLQKKVKDISGEHDIPITDLMTDSFIRQHSKFDTFQTLLDASGIKNKAKNKYDHLFALFAQENANGISLRRSLINHDIPTGHQGMVTWRMLKLGYKLRSRPVRPRPWTAHLFPKSPVTWIKH